MELALQIILAAVMAWAGIAKLLRLSRFAEALGDHGVPANRRRILGIVIGVSEVALAPLLAWGLWMPATAIVTGLLFTIFAVSLVRVRMTGRRQTRCACFGGARPRNTVALMLRAGILAVAAFLLAAGVPDVTISTATAQTVALVVLGAVVVALALAVLALYRQVGVLSLRLAPQAALELEDEGPPLGQPAPLLAGLTRRGPELVAFVSAQCRMCQELAPGLRALERDGLPVVVVREDTQEEVFDAWGVPGTPYVTQLVDGVVFAKGLVNSLEQIDWVLGMGEERHRHAA